MERLTKWLNDKKALCIEECEKACVKSYSECHKCKPFVDVLKKLADYEDAEEQGLLKMFPCKVGDVVYFPKYDYHDSAIITQIEIDKEGITFYWAQYEIGVDVTELWDDGCFSIDEIGKTVFLTREEAEQALAEMQKG